MLHHNIDQFVFQKGQIFAFGWGFSTKNHVTRLVMHLDFIDGLPLEIEAEYGRQRDDVKASFPSMQEADNCGFLIVAGVDQRKITHAVLRWELDDATTAETQIQIPLNNQQKNLSHIFAHYRLLGRKAFALVRSAGIGALMQKMRRYLTVRPHSADDGEWNLLCAQLRDKPLAIVVDHDMGGGANIYRNQHISQRMAKGEIVLLLGFHVASLQYFIEIFDSNSTRRYSVESPEMLLPLALCSKVQHATYNCAVSFRQPFDVIDTLIALKLQTSCKILVTIHDYFAICPSHFLIDSHGQFCGVPDTNQCRKCLPEHRDGFVSISGIRDINVWREKWATLLLAANEVRMFSNSSRNLLKRAYPLISDANWQVVPHTLHTQSPILEIPSGQHLHIGIVGAIGKHKGAEIVRHLSVEIERRNSNTKITVIGTLEAKVSHKIVSVTGAYTPDKLAEIIEKSGVNVFLFPSIWGETFSYVSHELVAMDVPFCCFDFGAPADLARRYLKGLVLNSMNAGNILDTLEQFWREIYQIENEAI